MSGTMIKFLLCVFCYTLTRAEQHTLQYLYTLRSAHENQTEFEITTVLDGLIISHCQRPSFRDQSRYTWVTEAFSADEWKNRDRFCEDEFHFHNFLKSKIKQMNTTNGILQRQRSCTTVDSEVYMSDRWGVNGEDFLTLDTETLQWHSESALASLTESEWNKLDPLDLSLKDFEFNRCKPSLMKLKEKKAKYLKQNLRPDVFVFAKPSHREDTVYLRCYVSHKYIPGLTVHLTLDGIRVYDNLEVSSPLPNIDGSVQIRLQTKTSIKEPNRYYCIVGADNLHVSVGWDGQTLKRMSVDQLGLNFSQVIIIFIMLLFVVTLIGIFCVAKRAPFILIGDNRQVNAGAYITYLQYNPTQEEFEANVEMDDEHFGPYKIG